MSESHPFELPAWVRQRDGRVAPFDPDRICQAIFRAGEILRQPNAFLAREMTDGVLHFLAQEYGSATPTTDQIAELVVKVLRELGQVALAQAFEQRPTMPLTPTRSASEGPPTDVHDPMLQQAGDMAPTVTLTLDLDTPPEQFLDECRRLFSVHGVFSRDLLAAQHEGFLSLAGLEHPAELEGGVLSWPGADEGKSLLAALLEARRRFGGFVALDSPEYACQEMHQIRPLVEQLKQGLEATRLQAIVNLNAEPPPWAVHSGQGPLFQTASATPRPDDSGVAGLRLALLEALWEHFPAGGEECLRIDWHVRAHDFQNNDTGLSRVLQAACQGRLVSFVFDRGGAPSALAEGVDRRHPAVLQVAGLHLTRLADMDDSLGQVDHLLTKLLHLAQMALSAGAQKRRFLKRLTEQRGSQADDLRRGFLLDRARLGVVPVGLPAVVQRFTGQGMTGNQGLALAQQIIGRLGQCLLQGGRSVNLDGVLDSPWWTGPRTSALPSDTRGQPGRGTMFSQPHLTGLTSADFAASAEDQLRAAGVLHQSAGSGTATLLLPADLAGNLQRLSELLYFAWKKTGLLRVRLARIPTDEPRLRL